MFSLDAFYVVNYDYARNLSSLDAPYGLWVLCRDHSCFYSCGAGLGFHVTRACRYPCYVVWMENVVQRVWRIP